MNAVKKVVELTRDACIAKARASGTLLETSNRRNVNMRKWHEADVVVHEGRVVKNKFGRCDP